ncbi:MAG: PIG-L deacetylase family protein [Acidobacteriota bacterium]
MMRPARHVFLLVCLVACIVSTAQHLEQEDNRVQVHQALLDLTTSYRLMAVAAHPDDEDAATLTFYRQHRGITTTLITSSYGEGGQNAIGPELYTELGVIRAHELQRAGETYGAALENLKFVDFGFSKTAQETFEKWGGRDKVVGTLVRVIRKYRPHVIITNHDDRSGHGNHQAVGATLPEALRQAGDATAFSDQLRDGLSPWVTPRLFLRFSERAGRQGAEAGRVFDVPTDEIHPVRGISYAEIGARGYSFHRSQTAPSAVRIPPGKRHYQFLGGAQPPAEADRDLFDGLPPVAPAQLRQMEGTLRRRAEALVASTSSRTQILEGLAIESRSVAQVLEGLPRMGIPAERRATPTQPLQQRHQRWHFAPSASPGQRLTIDVAPLPRANVEKFRAADFADLVQNRARNEVVSGSPAVLRVVRSQIIPATSELDVEFPAGWTLLRRLDDAASGADSYRTFYLLFDVPASTEVNTPETEVIYRDSFLQPQLQLKLRSQRAGSEWAIRHPVRLFVRPPVAVSVTPSARMIVRGDIPAPFQLHARLFRYSPDAPNGEIKFNVPQGVQMAESPLRLSDLKFRDPSFLALQGQVRDNPASPAIRIDVSAGGVVRSAEAKLQILEVHRPTVSLVGLIPGAEGSIEDGLRQLGVPFRKLGEEEILSENLSLYDVILIDSRAYFLNSSLASNNRRFLDYVRDGGHLVVFYQRAQEFNVDAGYPELAPYPLKLSSDRVSVEEAPVGLLLPDHPLLKTPHAIGGRDFEGWVQERGLYFPQEWDSRYQALLATADPGEKSLSGGLLVANYGKGTYIYTSFAWHRQIRAFHPAGYRMLVNFLSYGR